MFTQWSYPIRAILLMAVFVSAGFAADNNAAQPPVELTPTRRLLEKLAEQNSGNACFTDDWCRTLKEIVELGPDAVPELIKELDATSDDMMLRCLGFTLRAIGDRRAVPALIRAIPKTLRPPGSDMGVRADDPELMKFAQKYDLSERDHDDHYDFGRPVREICGAIQKLTGKSLSEEELFQVFLGGLPAQRIRQEKLFQRVTHSWAEMWEQNWKEYVSDESYSKVHLAAFDDDDSAEPIPPGAHFKTVGGGSNWILESVLNPKAKQVFYDLDVGRVAALPEKWRNEKEISSHMDEILFWARREGFDLMGTEHVMPSGQKIFAIRAIGLQVWELGPERWKMSSPDITLEELKGEGRPAEKFLFHFDDAKSSIAPLETAPFFYITRHGTPGLLFIGIEVQDDSLKPGGIGPADCELDPIAFYKGRRFGFTQFEIKP